MGKGRTGKRRHWVELVGAAASGPELGTQQTHTLDGKESGHATEKACRAMDVFIILLFCSILFLFEDGKD